MRSHDQYCPVAKAAEALGDKWSLLLIRELLHGVGRFNEFERCLPGISRSVLAQRLRHLERAGVIERRVGPGGRATEYRLTRAGHELEGVVKVLGDWGARWVLEDPRPAELDPDLLMVWIGRHMNHERLPSRRVVIQFDVGTTKKRRYWLVLNKREASVCLKHPGFEPDVRVTADPSALYRVYLGRLSLADAVGDELVRLDGPPTLVRQLPRWFAWSRFAPAARTSPRWTDAAASRAS